MVEIETHNDNERLFLNLTRNGNSERLVISYHMVFIVMARKTRFIIKIKPNNFTQEKSQASNRPNNGRRARIRLYISHNKSTSLW